MHEVRYSGTIKCSMMGMRVYEDDEEDVYQLLLLL